MMAAPKNTSTPAPVVTASILEAPLAGAGESEQLDLGKWAYDEVGCAPPLVDPLAMVQLYDRNVAHKACVDAKTANCVGLGWHFDLKKGVDDKEGEEQRTLLEDWLEACARRDNKSFDELLSAVRKDEESVGWGAFEITRNAKGEIDGFFHIHAYTLRRRKDRDGWVQKWMGEYRYFLDYGKKPGDSPVPDRFQDSNEILAFFEVTPANPFYGHPDHVPALGDILGDESAQQYQVQFFKNNAVPRLAICVNGGKLDQTTREYLLAYLRDGVRGDAHKTLLLETEAGSEVKITIEKLTIGTREDADFVNYRKWCRDVVIMAHRVSPSKVTIVENANLANSKDQDLTFKEQVIKPDQRRYETRIQWLLEDQFGRDIPVAFHFNEMALSDEEVIARTRSFYQNALLVNEVREANGYPKAGVDPETGETSDPVLEEWGRRPFEIQRGTNIGDFPGMTGATGMTVPLNDLAAAMASAAGKPTVPSAPGVQKAWSEFRQLQEMAKDLGFIIQQVEEVVDGERTVYCAED